MNQETAYDFEWDASKALANIRKHSITFDQAATVFLDVLALTVFDVAHSEQEERWFTLGQGTDGALLAVAHTHLVTETGNIRVRIISARPATRQERRFYEDEPR